MVGDVVNSNYHRICHYSYSLSITKKEEAMIDSPLDNLDI